MNHKRLLLTVVSTGILAVLTACGEGGPPATTREPPPGGSTPTSVNDLTALQQMEIAFNGNRAVSEIQPVLDRALLLYGLPITEENYSRAGSTLVALRKEHGPSEMDILDYMIRSHMPGVEISFPEAAAFSVIFLAVSDQ